MCGIVCGAFHEDLNRHDGSVSKSVYACTNEGDWCKNHACNFSHFDVDRLRLKKKKKKKQKHEEVGGFVVFCQSV